MKSKTLRSKAYSELIRRLFMQILAVLGAAAAFVLILRFAFRGKIADSIVPLFTFFLGVREDRAEYLYQIYIRNNMDLIIIVIVVIFFFIFFWLSLSWFTKYFDRIVDGVDKLAQETEEDIVMCTELGFMETKLNEVKKKLKKRSDEAKEAEQRKNDLVVYLAHDIKTPLTSVIGYLSLLDEAADMPVEQKAKYVHITLDKAYRLEQLINEFFEITRYNLQTITLSKENIDLYYMLAQMTDEFYPQLSANGKQAVIHASEDLTVYGDSDKLARVFNNILKNAVAYSPDNSVIDITAAISEDKVSIVFKNGGNIPKDKLMSIFDKFYRLDDARSSDTGGAGLGLAIAKEIVVLHEGQIHADSDGEHTTFTVELPVMLEKP